MPSITQLEYLIAVNRLRHFGKAAEACHVTQPTLSMQIQKLEEEFNIVLFDRRKQPIVPTPEAIAIIAQAQAVLREVKHLQELGRHNVNKLSGELKIASIPTLSPYLLPLFLTHFARQYADIHLQVDELTTETIVSKLEKGEIDVAVLATPIYVAGLVERVLFYEPFHIFHSQNHPLAALKKVKEDNLEINQAWLLSEGHCLRNQVINLCSHRRRGANHYQNLTLSSGSLETLIHLVGQGAGYTILPQLALGAVPEKNRSQIKKFSGTPPSREISLVFSRSHYKQNLIEVLESEIRKHLPKDLPLRKKDVEIISIDV